jgi:hypothetical protein
MVMPRLYEIKIGNVDLSPHYEHVLAEDIEEAFMKAQIIIEKYKKDGLKAAEILEISFECDVDDV